MTDLSEQLNAGLADFKDPFRSDYVSAVYFEVHPGRTFAKPINARVHFKNGNTGGSQSFEGTDFQVVCKQVGDFIKALEAGV